MNNNYREEALQVIADLHELRTLTADAEGSHRVAWTPVWDQALEWFSDKMRSFGANVSIDSAHNVYACIPGETSEALCIGSHLDSVPGGGWLDGALGVVAGIGIARHLQGKTPSKTLYIVSWADEEGARFGRSCVGSAAISGALVPAEVADLKDRTGMTFREALTRYGMTPEGMTQAHEEFVEKHIRQYLELHIEQAPVLESRGLSAAAVTGICGCEREYITFQGQRSHLGCPGSMRHDAFLAAAEAALAFRQIAERHTTDEAYAYCTVGEVIVSPNVINVVPDNCILSLDMRTLDETTLQRMKQEAHDACKAIAAKNGVQVTFETIWQIPPTHFDPSLIQLCQTSLEKEGCPPSVIVSGPLHDAAELAKCVPSAMMFIRSSNGLSHCKEEDTPEHDLSIGIAAFMRLVDALI